MMYTRSGLTWAEADMARSRNMSSCSSAVMKRADGVGTVMPDSCADGGTNAVAADTNDMMPMIKESMVTSDMLGEVFIMQGSSGHKVRGRQGGLKNEANCSN